MTVTSNSWRGYWSHPTIEHHFLHYYSNQSPSHLSLSNSCRSLLTGLSASAIALYPVILWSFKNMNQIMSVLWTNFPTTSHLTCIKTQGSYHGFQDPMFFCPHSSVTSFPTTVSWIHHPTAIFPPLCCSSNTVRMLLAHPSAWNTVFQISASLTSSFIQVSVQRSSYQKSLPWPACGQHKPLSSPHPSGPSFAFHHDMYHTFSVSPN